MKTEIKQINIEKEFEDLSFNSLVIKFLEQVQTFPDARAGNKSYQVEDAALGAFSAFFTQFPSFLSFQRSMQEAKGINNAWTLFGIEEIPSDNQIRNILDKVPPEKIFPIFPHILESLIRLEQLKGYREINGNLLMPLDATRYYSSKNVHCDQCSKTKHKNGEITYHHDVITPVIVAPGKERVISLEPKSHNN